MPRRVLAAGMPGSASTFVYNVAREILMRDRRMRTLATYSDEWEPHFAGDHHLVLKSHWGIQALAPLAESGRLLPLVTVRHPGDCVCSDMERFGYAFDFALKRVQLALAFADRLRQSEDTLVFRYEDGFAASPRTAGQIAQILGVSVGAADLTEITRLYGAASVRAYAAELPGRADVKRSVDGNNDIWCPITQIHRGHIGRTSTGRWRALPAEQRAEIADACGEDAAGFGYECGK